MADDEHPNAPTESIALSEVIVIRPMRFEEAVNTAACKLTKATHFERTAIRQGWTPPKDWHAELRDRLRTKLRMLVRHGYTRINKDWLLVPA